MLDHPNPRAAETLDDLLGPNAEEGAVAAFCRRARVPEGSLASLRRGLQLRPKAWILQNLADALDVPLERVRAAVHAMRAHRGR